MAKILLIDGSNFLFRAYNALPPLTTSKGEPTHAIKGVLNMISSVYKTVHPDFGAVVFDAKGKNFRHELYPEYKANRPPMDEDLRVQIEPLLSAIKDLGWPLISVSGVEADDVLGTLAKMAKANGDTTVIATGDKDMMQLVEDGISIFNSMSKVFYDSEAVETKYGVPPEKIIEYLALMGDKVDNVPGISGCGPKTAAKWIKEFGSIENLKKQAHTIKGVTGEKLRAGLPLIDKSIELVTIKIDCPIPGVSKPSDLAFKPANIANLKTFALRWEMSDKNVFAAIPSQSKVVETSSSSETPSLFDEVASADESIGTSTRKLQVPKYDVPHSSEFTGNLSPIETLDEAPYTLIDSPLFMGELEDFLNESSEVAVSFLREIDPDTQQERLFAASFSRNPLETKVVILRDEETFEAFLAAISAWIQSSSTKIFFGAKDFMHLVASRLSGKIHDVAIMHYVLEANAKHDLADLAKRFLGRTLHTTEELTAPRKKVSLFNEDSETIARIVADASSAIKALASVMISRLLTDKKLSSVYYEIEEPLTTVLFELEENGIKLDKKLLSSMQIELESQIKDIEQKIYALAHREFNIASTKQLREILFTEMGIKPIKKTATGQPSTDEEVLTELALNYPLPKLLLEFRGLSKLLSTYVAPLPQLVLPRDDRLHTTFNQTTAITGRLSSSNPNLQNIPVRTPEGRKIREAFVASPGCKIISADYSQVELRVMAHLSQDKGLLDAFHHGLDVHKATAAEVFGCSIDDVTSEMRRTAKVINFGLIYGMSAFGLAKNLEISRKVAANYIDTYFAKYPGVKRYMNASINSAHDLGYVETLFGRRLWIPQITMKNKLVVAEAERLAINAPVQGTAADIIKKAMLKVSSWLKESKLKTKFLLQVHDELILEVPDDEVELVKEKLPKIMSEAANLSVPLIAEVGVGPNWEKAH